MKTLFTLISLVFITSCADDVNFRPVCGNVRNKCYAVWTEHYKDPNISSERQADEFRQLAEQELVGECQLGTPTCDQNLNVIDCEGAVYPEQFDFCDGVDNDCDGTIDDYQYPQYGYSWPAPRSDFPDNPCGTKQGVCNQSPIECINGQLVCQFPPEYEPGEELTCDNLDNNCDGAVDNIDLKCTDILGNEVECTCYTGPIGTERYGECRSGYVECLEGDLICSGDTVPKEETCNFKDDDCNNIVDDTGDTLEKDYDIVISLDNSGSMCGYITALTGALEKYVEQFENNPHYRFALIIMSTYNPSVQKVVDFGSLNELLDYLRELGCSGSGAEASLDALVDICDPTNPLELDWRPAEDAKRIILNFTDERTQSYRAPNTTFWDVVDGCNIADTRIFTWHDQDPQPWIDMAAFTMARDFELRKGPSNEPWKPMLDDLNSIVMSLCDE